MTSTTPKSSLKILGLLPEQRRSDGNFLILAEPCEGSPGQDMYFRETTGGGVWQLAVFGFGPPDVLSLAIRHVRGSKKLSVGMSLEEVSEEEAHNRSGTKP